MVSLALGIIPACGGLPALVLGVVAWRRVSETGQKGKGHAIAGIALGGLWMVLIAVAVVVGLPSTAAERDASGRIVEGGRLPVASVRIGDCLEEVPKESSVSVVAAVACVEPHMAEVIGEFGLAEEMSLLKLANGEVGDECSRVLAAYAPDFLDEVAGWYFLSWYDKDSRGQMVTCVAVYGQPRTGSLRE